MAASARHETRALLRAHLSAASSYRHFTRHCPICHRLLRLATDTVTTRILTTDTPTAGEDRAEGPTEDESSSKA
ncbi:hypothetical protein CTU88_17655 [Streptomyces sp. JV178]|jgi:sarcosine oxidase delta subunit|uniref:DUF6274 family protein n=1 Tax=unclassified Streptomyces TaxID=2593676 RepID=UPI000C1B2E0F|nr:DUF6274 family protein [Streptomyces sp. JV178]PIM70419.1 hypothetical protein CTU88_17655 [Streptomyces sp. JV178]